MLIEGGSYQNVLVAALRAAELPVVIINPRRVREFAKSIGQLAKTTISTRGYWRFMANGFSRRCESCPTNRTRHCADYGSGANS